MMQVAAMVEVDVFRVVVQERVEPDALVATAV
jgi:hypothetical protein